MYPRCDDAAEAAEVVRWAKFAPLGQRGFDGAGPDAPYWPPSVADYVRDANRETFLVIQIESPQALAKADEIAAVEGVDALMLGPADFGILSGFPGQFDHPLIHEARRTIGRAAAKAGKAWGCPSGSVEQTQQLLQDGAQFICHNADIILVKNGLEKIRRDFAPLGFTFDSRLPA